VIGWEDHSHDIVHVLRVFHATTISTGYLYLFFGVDDSIVDDFTQRGDHSSGPMRNPKLTGMVM